jgi:YihY family inner membrane protein
MAASNGEAHRDLLGNVAAVAVLATAALEAKRVVSSEPRPAQRVDAATPADDVAAVAAQPGIKGRIDAFQAARPRLAFGAGVVRKFGDDRGGRLAALISYYGFFSIFPALLAMTTILGFVLDGNPDLAKRISDSALGQFPVIGDAIGNASQPLTGSTVALVVGLVGALWAGLGAAQAAQDAMNTIWSVPRPDQPHFVGKRLRSVATLVLIAVLFAANAVLPQLTGATTSGTFGVIVLILVSIVADAVVFGVIYLILTVVKLSWRDVWVGSLVAATGYVLLQTFGTLYIQHVLKGASDTYGTFASVIGLLSWMFLLGQVFIFAAVIDVVRARKLYPRSLFRPASTRADRRSQRSQMEGAKLTQPVDVELAFPARVADASASASAVIVVPDDDDVATAQPTSAG